MKSLVCNNEAARLEALRQYQILDTPPEEAFDDIAFLAAQICNTPIALINLIDANRQWFKAKVGLDVQEIPRDTGFCPICIESGEVLIIPDTLADERFAPNHLVTYTEICIRFYAGIPLLASGGEAIGTLCIGDRVPRQISPKQVEALQTLSRLVVRQLEIRREFAELASIKQEYKQAQEALLDIVTDAIVVQDLSNKILLWNKNAEELYGWKSEEAIGKQSDELFSTEPLPQKREIYQTVLKDGSWQGELEKTSKSGKKLIVESRWKLINDEHSQAKSILVVDTDITQKKQLEKQLLRAQRMESIGTLASGIAHDLNNVLSPILMSVHLLKSKIGDQQINQMLSIIENNAKRGADLVKQVLSFTRGIEGNVEGQAATRQCTVLQVKHLLLEMQQIISQTFPKSIAVYTEIQEELLPICADSTQLHQVLINLCLNARDAMPTGGNLTISAENIWIDETYASMHIDAKVGAYIVLTVTDTGLGINSEILDRIFEPFFTTKELGKGTGLGLSTVIRIIKEHDGFITVSSFVGKGTKFKVYLPAVNQVPIELLEDTAIPTGSGECILVVDDETAIQEITKTSLENYNYTAMTAGDGIEALAIYAQHKDKISAAIIDMMMSKMDGATTIRTLQDINPLLPIIVVSGLVTSEQVPIDKTDEHTAFLPKPYTTQELLKTLHAVISQ
ncbi:ATP-binding protein [Nostoc sphaeroides]|uniref:hybrid sensor histidine kinase/response regulator n=1 Tax=Nostoc sphaeroides TaxID=446679 RepID=UPI000E4E1426|nr:ATP-binding protein [Nostoc sphaeroides]